VHIVADYTPGAAVRREDGTVVGSLPDHRTSDATLVAAVAGRPVVADRAALAGELDPAEPTDAGEATAATLADPATRDAALLAVVAEPAARERWVDVVRHSTGGGRGRVAALLAAAYYAAGDGPRARVATDVAETCDPGNRLAQLVGWWWWVEPAGLCGLRWCSTPVRAAMSSTFAPRWWSWCTQFCWPCFAAAAAAS